MQEQLNSALFFNTFPEHGRPIYRVSGCDTKFVLLYCSNPDTVAAPVVLHTAITFAKFDFETLPRFDAICRFIKRSCHSALARDDKIMELERSRTRTVTLRWLRSVRQDPREPKRAAVTSRLRRGGVRRACGGECV